MLIPLHTCADFSNICGVHHMLFAIISTNSCKLILLWNELAVFADAGIRILIIHHRLYLQYIILCYIYSYIVLINKSNTIIIHVL